MLLDRIASPFADRPATEVPLGQTPLESVLFQVRFPGHLSKLQSALANGRLQDALSEQYPYAQQQETFNLVVAPGQAPQPQSGPPVWTIQDAGQDWICNFAADSFGLTTTSYTSRGDFIKRAGHLVGVVQDIARPPKANRIGMRYLNRVPRPLDDGGEWLMTLAEGARGVYAAAEPSDRAHIVNSLSQLVYEWSRLEKLQCRWGVLPANAIMDASMQAISDSSWVLDIDAFDESSFNFDVATIEGKLTVLAGRAYNFFRWVVTPESLERFLPAKDPAQ